MWKNRVNEAICERIGSCGRIDKNHVFNFIVISLQLFNFFKNNVFGRFLVMRIIIISSYIFSTVREKKFSYFCYFFFSHIFSCILSVFSLCALKLIILLKVEQSQNFKIV